MPFQRGGDNLVVLVVLALLGAVGVTAFNRTRTQQKAVDCLGRLAAGAGGTCPVSGQAYPADGPRRCPAPGTHLPTDPRFADGRVTQTFPAAVDDGLAIPDWTRWARMEVGSSGVVVTLAPRAWWRWVVGPVVVLAGVLGLLLLAANFIIELGRRPRLWPLIVMYGLLLGMVGLLVWNVVSTAWGSETVTVDRAARTVTRRRFVVGLGVGAPRVHADVRVLAPVAGARTVLMLAGADGRPVPLFAVRPEAVGRLAPLAEALFSR